MHVHGLYIFHILSALDILELFFTLLVAGSLNQGLSKHQEVCFTPVTKVEKNIVIFWDFFDKI